LSANRGRENRGSYRGSYRSTVRKEKVLPRRRGCKNETGYQSRTEVVRLLSRFYATVG